MTLELKAADKGFSVIDKCMLEYLVQLDICYDSLELELSLSMSSDSHAC